MDINIKLPLENQRRILNDLFGFTVGRECDCASKCVCNEVVYDDEGYEFYWFDGNDKFDLTTLKGIIEYYSFVESERKLMQFKQAVVALFG